jgi:hypothetical protein
MRRLRKRRTFSRRYLAGVAAAIGSVLLVAVPVVVVRHRSAPAGIPTGGKREPAGVPVPGAAL